MNFARAKEHSLADGQGQSFGFPFGPSVLMQGDGTSPEPQSQPLPVHQDARALVRLLQCPVCSKLLSTPVTLPCGHSVCRTCLPTPRLRENITYPNTPDRQHGISCPQWGCGREHPVVECNIDVILSKFMVSLREEVEHRRFSGKDSAVFLEEIIQGDDLDLSEAEKDMDRPRFATLEGGRLVATFLLADTGELAYESEVSYQYPLDSESYHSTLDESILNSLRDVVRRELDCHVCYNTLLDPVTTCCGHTFCRKCLCRALDHSRHCPICRRDLPMPPSLGRQPSNERLTALLSSLCLEIVTARAAAVAQEEHPSDGVNSVSLFVCTLSFPEMPTFLHIFEPRYRLMVRRAMEGNRRFGMVMYNRHAVPQGELGVTQFMEYGTLLEILHMQLLPDGRSYLETRGIGRFRVRSFTSLDGYAIGDIELVEDISLAEEERHEARETSTTTIAAVAATRSTAEESQARFSGEVTTTDREVDFNTLSTQELLVRALDFIERARIVNPAWLSRDVLAGFGTPPHDPALFPYWFASVFPIDPDEGYQLLQATSVRERLKIVNMWIQRIEGQRWYNGDGCAVL